MKNGNKNSSNTKNSSITKDSSNTSIPPLEISEYMYNRESIQAKTENNKKKKS